MSSFDDLDEIEKNIFLDISCFFKGEVKEEEEEILSCLYEGTVSGINTLLNKCLLDIDSYRRISMHDMLEEMGKDIVHQESKDPEKRSRLWDFKEVNQVHRYNKENTSIEGIKFRMTRYDPLLSCRHGFENMLNLRYIDLSTGCLMFQNDKVLAHKVDSLSFPDELRYLYWSGYPFKSLSPNYNPKNLAVLKLRFGCMEQLWNGDHQDLVNLRIIDLSDCVKLRKIPNLSGAINLNSFFCRMCGSLVGLPCLSHLPSLEILDLSDCMNLRKIPNLLEVINLKSLNISSCLELVEPLELPNNITELNLSHTVIKEWLILFSILSHLES
ncbi:disease resistance protein RPP2A-like [Hibiscus syriacus]|uniref:disease resistance protein RPP2A-like n=1 Tax=Hibiscus syriacus TaxID=106335 RepID=UPI00192106DC|nr:disease resistance protein RPP2A-like [Hibiscus syriacus]